MIILANAKGYLSLLTIEKNSKTNYKERIYSNPVVKIGTCVQIACSIDGNYIATICKNLPLLIFDVYSMNQLHKIEQDI